MAGDWIPIRTDLHEDPAVIGIALALNIDEFSVTGRLIRLWSWVSHQTVDGVIPFVTLEKIDHIVQATGFAAAMVKVGWLRCSGDGVYIPNFDHWLSESAKERLQNSRRQRLSRKKRDKKVTAVLSMSLLPEEEVNHQPEKRGEGVGEGASELPSLNGHANGVGDAHAAFGHPDAADAKPERPGGRCVPFADFWALYPLKAEELRAKRQWGNLFVTAELFALMRLALGEQRQSAQWRSGKIPHAWRWLEGERWKDELRREEAPKNHELTKHRFRDPGRFAAEATG